MTEPRMIKGAGLREIVGLLRSVIASGETLTEADNEWIDRALAATPDPAGLREAVDWPETRRLVLEGRVVISQTPSDPGDIGEPRIAEVDDTTYVSVPEFELWPTDRDWEPHDASIVYVTRSSFTRNAPGRLTYHQPSRHTRYSERTGCGIEIWSSGWEPGQQSSLIAVRRDVASRVARPCGICGADR